MSTRDELLAAALSYAARGWRVVPLHYPTGDGCSCVVERAGVDARCPHEGKHPALRGGVTAGSVDPEKIRRWWASKPWNVGICTGAGTARGLLVVDVDPRHAGDVGLDEFEHQHGRLPPTVEACTGGGGRHLLFAYDPATGRVPCSASKLGPGVDVRADGGLIVAPPSMHPSGRAYGWELSSDPAEVPVVDAPPSLLRACRAPSSQRVGVREGARQIVRVVGETIREGGRNEELFRIASGLRARGLDGDELAAALLDVNDARCVPPLDPDEVHALAAQACRYAPGLSPSYAAQRDAGERSAALSERKGLRVGGFDEATSVPEDTGVGAVVDEAPPLPQPPRASDVAPRPGGGAGEARTESAKAKAARAFLVEMLGDLANDGTAWDQHLTRGRKGALENSIGNTFLILRNDTRVLRARPRFNELTLFAQVGDDAITDTAMTALRAKIERHWSMSPAKDTLADALRLSAELDAFNPVTDYLSGLTWDGVRRIDRIAPDWFGTPEHEALYARFVQCFFFGAVARAFNPGCNHASVLVLVGGQGWGKSRFFRELAGPFFNESKIEVGEKDGAIKTHAAWIHEFPEIESITLFREASAVKSFITLESDLFRPPYGRSTVKVARSSIFVGTTNQDDFLRDESGSGSRRWHPVQITRRIPCELVRDLRDQLWAEAVVRWRAGESSRLTVDEEARREELSRAFQQRDEWENAVVRWLSSASEVHWFEGLQRYGASSLDLHVGALGHRRGDVGLGESRRLGGIMKRMGWEHTKQRFPVGSGTSRRLGDPENGYLAPHGWRRNGGDPVPASFNGPQLDDAHDHPAVDETFKPAA